MRTGNPVAKTWIYLKETKGSAFGGANLAAVKTDAFGQWTASLHPNDATAFSLVLSSKVRPAKFSAGQPVDAEAAAAKGAVSVVPP